MSRPAYLDFQATTILDPRVLDEMLPFTMGMWGNPHSRSHAFGWEAEHVVEKARSDVGDLIKARAKDIIFTSGATEANNLAIKGVAHYQRATNAKKHLITTQIEHKCVLASMMALEEDGFEVTYLPVDSEGLVSPDAVAEAIRPDTCLVSVMYVNNEIGSIQPIKEIAEICKKKKVLFHTDIAQAAGKIPIDVTALGVDLCSISAHKMYGPKGMGALYVASKPKRVRLTPQLNGGGQERGLRSGTVPSFLAVGMGTAARISAEEMENDHEHISRLGRRLYDGICAETTEAILNGPKDPLKRYQGNWNISFAYVEGESLLMSLENVAVSSGSACTSASLEPSYVLRAIGVGEDLAHTSIRFGIGRFTTEEEVDRTVEAVNKEVHRLREMSPLWEMAQSGADMKLVWT